MLVHGSPMASPAQTSPPPYITPPLSLPALHQARCEALEDMLETAQGLLQKAVAEKDEWFQVGVVQLCSLVSVVGFEHGGWAQWSGVTRPEPVAVYAVVECLCLTSCDPPPSIPCGLLCTAGD